ncbi:YrrS family protein [Salinibacillus aidingensis]|uniref:YrrS family protein n=1 Tax=Salinibacillus aidingensis TaxID=237684 RepID=A0ABN1ASN3_9BACI
MSNSFFDDGSRVDRFSKRRKNTKLMNTLIVLAVLLSVFLVFTFVFNDDEEQANKSESDTRQQTESEETGADTGNENDSSEQSEAGTENGTSDEGQENADDESSSQTEENSDLNTEEATVTESEDPNVLKVIEKDWEPIGTEQEEPHETTYEKGTADWEEMWSAAAYATGLGSDYISWWVTNGGGPQRVKITISDKAETQTYRVYLQWVPNEGWKPEKVEVLKENDIKQKHFSDDIEGEDTDQEESEKEEGQQQESGE